MRLWLLLAVLLMQAVPSWGMEQYTEVLRDQYGRAITGATVTVKNAGSATLATIYSDNVSTAKPNPFLTNALDGSLNFYASNGVYDITFSYPGITFDASKTRRIGIFDVNDFSGGGGGGGTASCYKLVSDVSYTVVAADNNCVVEFSNAATVAVTLPQAGTSGFTATFRVTALNRGAGDVIITPTISSIQGDTDLTLTTGQSTDIQSDGTNYVYTPGIVPATGWPQTLTTAASTSEVSPVKFCGIGLLADDCYYIYVHSNGTPTIRGVRNGVENDLNIEVVIGSGRQWILKDSSGNVIVQIEPGASGMGSKYTFGASYRPIKSIWFGAASLYGDGTNCPTDPTAVTINSGPKIPTFICADNNGSRLTGAVKMPDSYDGGTITLTHVYIQTAADTNALHGDVAAQCRGNGAVVNNTWGTEIAIDDAGVTGGARNDFTTSAAITPNGTCTGAPMLYWYYELDATGTTTAAATLHHVGFMMEYSVTSWSD